MPRPPMLVGVSDLRRRLGAQRDVHVQAPLAGLEITTARVHGTEVALDGVLESIEGGITVTGTVSAHWTGQCRRCLEDVEGEIDAPVREVFEHQPTDGETYPIHGDEIDLEPVVRDAVLLSLPLAPLCREDCRGPAPEQFPAVAPADEPAAADDEAPTGDPRWSALDQLKFD